MSNYTKQIFLDSLTSVREEIPHFRSTNNRKNRNIRKILLTHGLPNINQTEIKFIPRNIHYIKIPTNGFWFQGCNRIAELG
jgi:hypothetical protein